GVQFMLARGGVTHSYINLENGMVQTGWSQDGQSILTPTNSTAIPNLVHRLFSDPMLAQENAPIAVLNGSTTSGAASDAESTLQTLGFHTVSVGNADSQGYRQTQVILNSAAQGQAGYNARRLQRILGAQLVTKPVPGQSARIVVVIGSDFP
ncbi:MAG TPA: LytR C-terminal domain-containing protein, partial [Chloroflexota bacterium]